MKKGLVVILWTLLLIVGLSLSSCQREVPVDEIPVDQTENVKPQDPDEEKPEGEMEEESGEEIRTEPEMVEVTLYLPNEMADGFLTSSMVLENAPETIVAQLVTEGALPEGVHILDFDPEQQILNMSKEFGEAMSSTGTTGEMLYMGSLVNTLLEHYGLEAVMVYAEGEVIETGHVTYDTPVQFIGNHE